MTGQTINRLQLSTYISPHNTPAEVPADPIKPRRLARHHATLGGGSEDERKGKTGNDVPINTMKARGGLKVWLHLFESWAIVGGVMPG